MPPADADDVNVPTSPGTPAGDVLLDELRSVAVAGGLDRIGVCDTSILERARTELHRRKAAGRSDTMQFTFRNPDRSTNPLATMADARSIVVGARSYHVDDSASTDVMADADFAPYARVAKYAQYDHYSALRSGLEAVASVLRREGFTAVVIADENNLVDREVAYRAGLGWFGKNANLLLPGAGSWFVLGSVLTNAELPHAVNPVSDGCGLCRRCIDACPTGAIVADGVIDARKCLAWLVQKPGVFPREYRIDLGDRIYGCDDCQDSCPITVRLGQRHATTPVLGQVPGRSESTRGDLVHSSDGRTARIGVLDILEASDEDLMERLGRWYIPERNPIWVRRNALIILGNVAPIPLSPRVVAILKTCARSDDSVIRAQTLWTAHRVGAREIVSELALDSDPHVKEELEHLDRVPSRVPNISDAVAP